MAEGNVDLIVKAAFFPDVEDGLIVDVGAAHPNYLSISASFRNQVGALSPSTQTPTFVSSNEAWATKFWNTPAATTTPIMWSSASSTRSAGPTRTASSPLSPFLLLAFGATTFSRWQTPRETGNISLKRSRVTVARLDTILQIHALRIDAIDIVAIDVESWEIEVLKGLSVARYRPKVMIIGNLFDSVDYRHVLGELGYSLWRVYKPNDVYVRNDLQPVNPHV